MRGHVKNDSDSDLAISLLSSRDIDAVECPQLEFALRQLELARSQIEPLPAVLPIFQVLSKARDELSFLLKKVAGLKQLGKSNANDIVKAISVRDERIVQLQKKTSECRFNFMSKLVVSELEKQALEAKVEELSLQSGKFQTKKIALYKQSNRQSSSSLSNDESHSWGLSKSQIFCSEEATQKEIVNFEAIKSMFDRNQKEMKEVECKIAALYRELRSSTNGRGLTGEGGEVSQKYSSLRRTQRILAKKLEQEVKTSERSFVQEKLKSEIAKARQNTVLQEQQVLELQETLEFERKVNRELARKLREKIQELRNLSLDKARSEQINSMLKQSVTVSFLDEKPQIDSSFALVKSGIDHGRGFSLEPSPRNMNVSIDFEAIGDRVKTRLVWLVLRQNFELRALKAKSSGKEKLVEQMKADLESKDFIIKSLHETIDSLTQVNLSFSKELSNNKSILEELMFENNAKVKSLSEEVAVGQARVQKLCWQLDIQKKECSNQQETIGSLGAQLDSLRKENKRLSEDLLLKKMTVKGLLEAREARTLEVASRVDFLEEKIRRVAAEATWAKESIHAVVKKLKQAVAGALLRCDRVFGFFKEQISEFERKFAEFVAGKNSVRGALRTEVDTLHEKLTEYHSMLQIISEASEISFSDFTPDELSAFLAKRLRCQRILFRFAELNGLSSDDLPNLEVRLLLPPPKIGSGGFELRSDESLRSPSELNDFIHTQRTDTPTLARFLKDLWSIFEKSKRRIEGFCQVSDAVLRLVRAAVELGEEHNISLLGDFRAELNEKVASKIESALRPLLEEYNCLKASRADIMNSYLKLLEESKEAKVIRESASRHASRGSRSPNRTGPINEAFGQIFTFFSLSFQDDFAPLRLLEKIVEIQRNPSAFDFKKLHWDISQLLQFPRKRVPGSPTNSESKRPKHLFPQDEYIEAVANRSDDPKKSTYNPYFDKAKSECHRDSNQKFFSSFM